MKRSSHQQHRYDAVSSLSTAHVTHTDVKQIDDGKWVMKGPAAVLVTKSSATHCRHWEDGAEHICAIVRTHSDMVKFGPQDHEYDKTRERIRGLARRALTVRRRLRASNTKCM